MFESVAKKKYFLQISYSSADGATINVKVDIQNSGLTKFARNT